MSYKTKSARHKMLHKISDARWRANLADSFSVLKNICPSKPSRGRVSKVNVLRETNIHISTLESLLAEMTTEEDLLGDNSRSHLDVAQFDFVQQTKKCRSTRAAERLQKNKYYRGKKYRSSLTRFTKYRSPQPDFADQDSSHSFLEASQFSRSSRSQTAVCPSRATAQHVKQEDDDLPTYEKETAPVKMPSYTKVERTCARPDEVPEFKREAPSFTNFAALADDIPADYILSFSPPSGSHSYDVVMGYESPKLFRTIRPAATDTWSPGGVQEVPKTAVFLPPSPHLQDQLVPAAALLSSESNPMLTSATISPPSQGPIWDHGGDARRGVCGPWRTAAGLTQDERREEEEDWGGYLDYTSLLFDLSDIPSSSESRHEYLQKLS